MYSGKVLMLVGMLCVASFLVVFLFGYYRGPLSETSCYYTYSTIAQTLAASFGILGAFLLYRLQTISSHMRDILELVYHLTKTPYQGYHLSLFVEDYEALLRKLELDDSRQKEFSFAPYIEHMSILSTHKRALTMKASAAFFFTAPTMIVCVLLLPLVSLFWKHPTLSSLLLGFVVALTTLCVFLYAELIISSVKLPKKQEVKCEQERVDEANQGNRLP